MAIFIIFVILLMMVQISVAENEMPSYTDGHLSDNSLGSSSPVITVSDSTEQMNSTGLNDENMLSSPSAHMNRTESILTVGTWGNDQENAAIWEDRVVWADRREYNEEHGNYQYDIYLYNLSTGQEIRLTSTPCNEFEPDIWGNSVVWQVQAYDDNSSEIHLLDLSIGQDRCITDDSVNQAKPRIWEGWIVWQDGEEWDTKWGVSLYNCTNNTTISLGTSLARSPSIWDDRVVLIDSEDGVDWDLSLYNITTGKQVQITADPSIYYRPSIWGEKIVWQDEENGSSRIFLYNITTGVGVPITDEELMRKNPALSGDLLVYVTQNGTDKDISLVDLRTSEETELSRDTTGSTQENPDIWGNRIVWTDRRNGDADIYLSTLGTSRPPLSSGFGQNITQGEPPLTVAFSDLTTGEVAGWLWDFGDNTTSTEQNPVHVYSSAGSRSVTLTVHNDCQRDAIRKQDLISVGTAPIAQFTADQVNGPIPFNVSFQDRSLGNPVQWLWDFGDNTNSTEQNPVHTYTAPGVFTVNLTVTNIYGTSSIEKEDLVMVTDASRTTCSFPSEGINATTTVGGTWIVFNLSSQGNWTFDPVADPARVDYSPPGDYHMEEIEFIAADETGFARQDPDLLSGNLSSTMVRSIDIHPGNLSTAVGNSSMLNFTATYKGYPAGGNIRVVAWEGVTPSDYLKFDEIANKEHYNMIQGLAYTVQFIGYNVPGIQNSTFIFSVSSDWVQEYGWSDNRDIEIASNVSDATVFVDGTSMGVYMGVNPIIVTNLSPGEHQLMITKNGYKNVSTLTTRSDKRDSIHVIRIGDNGSGEVLNTTFIGHDPGQNVDYFMAESPNGLSTFGLASLSRSGSIFQMLYLSISGAVKNSRSGGGGGGGGTYSGVAGAGTTATPVATPTPAATLTPHPTNPSAEPTSSPTTPQPVDTKTFSSPDDTPTPPGDTVPGPSPETGTAMILVRNLAVVAVVALVTVIFYFRWKKQ